jgi:chemotaxis protein CheD
LTLVKNKWKTIVAVQIDVPTAGHAIATAPDSLTTEGVGSCIIVCLYSQKNKTGALLHCMLPRAENDNSNPYRCVDTALDRIVVELLHRGIKIPDLTAKLVGGAQMFVTHESRLSIGQQNIDETLRILNAMGISVVASDVGGNSGRSLTFDINTGLISIFKALSDPSSPLDTNRSEVL